MGGGCCNGEKILQEVNNEQKNKSNNNNNNNITNTNEDINESLESYKSTDKLKKISTLDYGENSKVEKVKSFKSGKTYALKITSLGSPDKVKYLVKEQNILSKCHHPNIISFKDIYKDKSNNTINMILEYAKGGTLKSKLNEEKNIEENTLIFWLMQICLGLSYLHKKNIIHRDIKPENILLTKNGLIKICDLGLAKIYDFKTDLKRKNTLLGTYYYMAPEIVKSGGIYDEKVDIYSLGKIFIQCIDSKMNYTDKFKNLIKSLLECPDNRPTSDEILNNQIIIRGMEIFLEKYNYTNSISNLIMNKIDINNINYIKDDKFIEDIKKERKILIKKGNNKYNNENDSKDLDILMCIIFKKKNEQKNNK